MSVLLGLKKSRRLGQLLGSASQASPSRIPWFGVATPDLFVRLSMHSATRKSGPSERRVRLWSSQVRSQTMQVLTRADATPSPIADNADCRIP